MVGVVRMTLKDSVDFGERRGLWPGGERRTKLLMWEGDLEGAEAKMMGEFPKSITGVRR